MTAGFAAAATTRPGSVTGGWTNRCGRAACTGWWTTSGAAAWIGLYKRHRALIHSGRMVRADTPDDSAWVYGVVAPDASAALMNYVQLAEPPTDQPVALRVPGLDPGRRYRLADVTPVPPRPGPGQWPEAQISAIEVSGAALTELGLAIAPRTPLTPTLVFVEAL